MTALSSAERQQRRRDKLKQSGKVKVEVWVTPKLAVKIREMANG